jgi:hypothetical protein
VILYFKDNGEGGHWLWGFACKQEVSLCVINAFKEGKQKTGGVSAVTEAEKERAACVEERDFVG